MSDSVRPERLMTAAPVQTGLMSAESQRAIAEVQAGMMIARMNPRDLVRARDLILQDCTRDSLAERAVYSYNRGGADVSGPSIRLAEVMAQRLGNISYGVRELEQRAGESVVQAYAQDMETGTRREMTFTVKHIRDTKKGRYELTDARDIYEMTANQGARRLRACLLGIIPGDITEAAVRQCELTLQTKTPITPERVSAMLDFFAENNVTRAMIEARIQRRIDALTPALFVQLGKIANSLRDGMSKPADWFEVAPEDAVVNPLDAVPEGIVREIHARFESLGWNPARCTVFVNKHTKHGVFDVETAMKELVALGSSQPVPPPDLTPKAKPSRKRAAKAHAEATAPSPSPAVRDHESETPVCEHGVPIEEPCDICISIADALVAGTELPPPSKPAAETPQEYAARRRKELEKLNEGPF